MPSLSLTWGIREVKGHLMCELNVIPRHYNLLIDLIPKDELRSILKPSVDEVINFNFYKMWKLS